MTVKSIPNRTVFFWALCLAVYILIPYEWYWRTVKQYPRSFDLESLDYWAVQRSKLSTLDSFSVVIVGSSRAHFDINIHLWHSLTGKRPLQLAYPGSSPYHPLADVVENSDFRGLLVIGVAPGLFFTTSDSWGANRGKAFVDHFYERTYAQIFSSKIYSLIDPHFSYLNEGLTLDDLIDRIQLPNRDSIRQPDIWPPMVEMDRFRNIRMIPLMETDSITQQRQKDIWFNPNPKNSVKDTIDTIMDYYVDLVHRFKDRGGRVVFIRAPITEYYCETENKLYPRKEYWDRLLNECQATGYHFEDHPLTQNMNPPEWSHLNRKESDIYTTVIVQLLQQDKLL